MAAEVARASDLPAWAEKYIDQPEHASSRQSPETSGGLAHALIEGQSVLSGSGQSFHQIWKFGEDGLGKSFCKRMKQIPYGK